MQSPKGLAHECFDRRHIFPLICQWYQLGFDGVNAGTLGHVGAFTAIENIHICSGGVKLRPAAFMHESYSGRDAVGQGHLQRELTGLIPQQHPVTCLKAPSLRFEWMQPNIGVTALGTDFFDV